jgi:hypothetical protein
MNPCDHTICLWLDIFPSPELHKFILRPAIIACASCRQNDDLPRTWQLGVSDLIRIPSS